MPVKVVLIVKPGISFGALLLLSLGLSACNKQADEVTWTKTFGIIETKFPNVPQLSTEELDAWIYRDNREAPILFDARRRDEYEVSHLEGAHLYASPHAKALLASRAKDSALVVYCSVGWRPAKAVQQLQALGYTNSYNLKGSIFEWANQGMPLVNDNGPTRVVHPYGNPWAKLLKPEYRHVTKD